MQEMCWAGVEWDGMLLEIRKTDWKGWNEDIYKLNAVNILKISYTAHA